MGLREVRILRSDHDHSIPELLLTEVMPEAFGNDVCFADGTARVTERLLVVAQQQVDAGSPGLLALQQGTDS